jgi:hypothetical protein
VNIAVLVLEEIALADFLVASRFLLQLMNVNATLLERVDLVTGQSFVLSPRCVVRFTLGTPSCASEKGSWNHNWLSIGIF